MSIQSRALRATKAFCVAAGLVLWALLPVVVWANSGPAPAELWLRFDDVAGQPISPRAVQLLGCGDDEGCADPALLQSYGPCTDAACHAGPATLDAWQPLDCAGNICMVAMSPSNRALASPLTVLVQSEWGVQRSQPAQLPYLESYRFYWQLTLQPDGITLNENPELEIPNANGWLSHNLFSFFIFTVVVEMLLVATWLAFIVRPHSGDLAYGLLSVLFANIISYPLTWALWASLLRFEDQSFRRFILVTIGVSLLYTAYLLFAHQRPRKARRNLWIAAVVMLPVLAIFLVILLIMFSFGSIDIALRGISEGWAIVLAELFAILLEGGLIYALSRPTIRFTLKQAYALSVAMNVASFVLGRLFLPG